MKGQQMMDVLLPELSGIGSGLFYGNILSRSDFIGFCEVAMPNDNFACEKKLVPPLQTVPSKQKGAQLECILHII